MIYVCSLCRGSYVGSTCTYVILFVEREKWNGKRSECVSRRCPFFFLFAPLGENLLPPASE